MGQTFPQPHHLAHVLVLVKAEKNTDLLWLLTLPQENYLLQGKDLVVCNNFLAIKATLLLSPPRCLSLNFLRDWRWGLGEVVFGVLRCIYLKKKKKDDVQMATVSI